MNGKHIGCSLIGITSYTDCGIIVVLHLYSCVAVSVRSDRRFLLVFVFKLYYILILINTITYEIPVVLFFSNNHNSFQP